MEVEKAGDGVMMRQQTLGPTGVSRRQVEPGLQLTSQLYDESEMNDDAQRSTGSIPSPEVNKEGKGQYRERFCRVEIVSLGC